MRAAQKLIAHTTGNNAAGIVRNEVDNNTKEFCRDPRNESSSSQLQFYEVLGAGTFGKVYRAYDRKLQKEVAVKMIELDCSGDVDEILLELRFLGELRSEYITQYYSSILQDSVLLVTMEFCEVGSCTSLLRVHSIFREDSAAYVIHEVLKGLQYIHDQRKIHRDLKSANILVTAKYGVKIADFGVSAQLSRTLPDRESFMGTPYWMAPEVIAAAKYDTTIDIWSMGIVTYELLTGHPPHRRLPANDAMMRIVNNDPPKLPNVIRGRSISKGLDDFTSMCLTKDPIRRPSAADLLATKYMRSRDKPPNEFKLLVNATLRSKADRLQNIKPCSLDDLESLSPIKSQSSRYYHHMINEADYPDFSLNSTDGVLGEKNSNVPHLRAVSNAPSAPSLAPPPALSVSASPPPELPKRLKPASKQASPKPGRPDSGAVATQWMHAALARVAKRTTIPSAVARIEYVREEIDTTNGQFPGFTKTFIEEISKVIEENRRAQRHRPGL